MIYGKEGDRFSDIVHSRLDQHPVLPAARQMVHNRRCTIDDRPEQVGYSIIEYLSVFDISITFEF